MDFYETLGVSRNASTEEIERSYRKLARQHHPDRNIGDASAAKRFIAITTAFDTLSNGAKRSRYDLQYRASPPPKKTKTKEDFEREKAEEKKKKDAAKGVVTQADLDAVKCTFFGGVKQGKSIMTWLNLTDTEKKKGGSKVIPIKKREWCPHCASDGTAMQKCPQCESRNPEISWCPICDGIGAILNKCSQCQGEGLLKWIIDSVLIRWSPNIQSGHTVNVLGAGEMGTTGLPPGNLRVVIL
jgi:molecular chaperone DnaJ